jgi:Flp pilus assembly protein TadG
MNDESGQAAVWTILGTLVLTLLIAGLVDLARLWEYRTWGYRVAESAALSGLAHSRDYAEYMATGEISLESATAYQDAIAALQGALARRTDLTAISYDVRVHAADTATVYADYPPVERAGMRVGDWAPEDPGVGVYLEFAVQPVLYGWVNGNQTVPIHVFAAASVTTH